ncbi:MAG: hypothetical protein DI565_15935 [Ancylobacter novellus]|uniref:Uncharacterized protein n=1 Tax=Ancylobacter novellus TaxID=921 RepID=A0A2W5K679_ANCNO|nr:MAG: hypothetical protein DI565_15935 [Ancylobacter novellus]
MSRRPIDRSPDLLRLRNEGYDLDIRGGYLLVRDVPYVDGAAAIRRGVLISRLELAGDTTVKPTDHVCYWTGEHPCHADGSKITTIENPSEPQDFGDGVKADYTFSAKADYRDYHHKITTYIGRIAGEAASLDPDVTARTYPAVAADDAESVFKYVDTATSRANIGPVNAKLAGQRVAILGLGGSGSYVFDLVAKTHVFDIHLIDGDVFAQHNAFRAPGAAPLEALERKPKKVAYFAEVYGAMRNRLHVHDVFIDETNVALLDGMDFVFVCIDEGEPKRLAVERLVRNETPFVETGMGVLLRDDQLGGIARVAVSAPDRREAAARHISYADGDAAANEYAANIQIAELNALSAALAVIEWKKLFGVYRDTSRNHHLGYSIASGDLVREGAA